MLGLLMTTAVVAAIRGLWSPCGLSMLSALNPVAETARGHRFWVTACWYVAGTVVGGAVLGGGCAAAAAAVGRTGLPSAAALALAAVAAVVAVVSDTAVTPWSPPVHPRQVDETWLHRYRRWIYAAGFGVQIGTGFATYIMTAAVYLTAALAVLTGDPGQAFAAGLVFGAVRGLTITVAGVARTPERLRALLARVDALDARSLLAAALVEALVGVAAAWLAAGPALAAAVAVVLGAVLAAGLRRAALAQ